MPLITAHPRLLLVVSFILLWLATRIGMALGVSRHAQDAPLSEHYGLIVGATLTLIGLIIGFSFSMAVSRYDQRKSLEEAEANAIGTDPRALTRLSR